MLESLILRNFQKHAKLVIPLGERITTFVGPSDVGKSAIFRALRWLATNKPAGDAFIRHGEKSTSVTLRVDGWSISHGRSASSNTYEIKKKGEEAQEFKAFGIGLPDPVTDILNMDEINFQRQHDAPMWFFESAGQVAKSLNAIVDLSIIDESLSFLSSAVRKTKNEKEGCEAALVHAQKELNAIAPRAELLAEKWARVEATANSIEAVTTSIEANKKQIEALQEVRSARKKAKTLAALANTLETNFEVISSLYKKRDTTAELRVCLFEITKEAKAASAKAKCKSQHVKQGEKFLSTAADFKTARDDAKALREIIAAAGTKPCDVPDFSKIQSMQDMREELQPEINALKAAVAAGISARAAKAKAESTLKSLHPLEHETCPLCNK